MFGMEGIELIDQLATSVVGRRDGGAMAKKGICKEAFCRYSQWPLRLPFHAEFTSTSSHYEAIKRPEGGGKRREADAHGVGLSHRYPGITRIGRKKGIKG